MSKRRDWEYLSDILESIGRILAYTEGMAEDQFMTDAKTQDAVVRNLEIIGEATKKLSPEIRDKFPDVPWKDMAGVRDKLIHHYFGIRYQVVWRIVRHDIPSLHPVIAQVLDSTDKSRG